jgi:hypothetical protein
MIILLGVLLLPLQPIPHPHRRPIQHPMARHHRIIPLKPDMRGILIILGLPEEVLCCVEGRTLGIGGVTHCSVGLGKAVG